jgi:hypothetical protein
MKLAVWSTNLLYKMEEVCNMFRVTKLIQELNTSIKNAISFKNLLTTFNNGVLF